MVMVVMPRPAGQPIELFQGDEQQQQRQAGDHLGHDQRRGGHRVEGEAAAKLAEARQAEAGERAQNHRAGGVDEATFSEIHAASRISSLLSSA
jgi:hypothetical protein